MKGALNANINVYTVFSLKMLSINEIDNKFDSEHKAGDKKTLQYPHQGINL